MQTQDEASVQSIQSRDAPAKIASQAIERVGLVLIELKRALQAIIAHVDEGKRCFAVGVQTLKYLFEKLLPPFDKLGQVVRIDEQMLGE